MDIIRPKSVYRDNNLGSQIKIITTGTHFQTGESMIVFCSLRLPNQKERDTGMAATHPVFGPHQIIPLKLFLMMIANWTLVGYDTHDHD